MTVLVALTIPVMILMVVLVANVGQMVFEKIRLQNTVDTIAMAAATVQAVGLNEIADLNWEMQNEHRKIKKILNSSKWYSKKETRNALNFFYNGRNGVLDHIYRYQNDANKDYAEYAWEIAQKVKDDNLPDTLLERLKENFELAEFERHFEEVSFRYYKKNCLRSSCRNRQVLLWSDPDDPRYYDLHDGRRYRLRKRELLQRAHADIPERLEKKSIAYVDYELHQPAKKFYLGSRIFELMPALTARAAAKPNGGHIMDCNPAYRAELFR